MVILFNKGLKLDSVYVYLRKNGVSKMGYRERENSNRSHGSRGKQGFDRGSSEMHKSVCADCGKECEVPFKPTGNRPVYCTECWAKNRPLRREDRRQTVYPREDRQRKRSPASENVDLQILAELKRIRELLEKGANENQDQTPDSASYTSQYKTGKKRATLKGKDNPE
jgi:CxxC-x17-CxxC domain-containing protein